MTRLAATLVAIALLLSLAAAAPVPEGAKGPVLYYPVQKGATWTYATPTEEYVLIVTAVEERRGRTVVTVGRVLDDGTVTLHERVEVSDQGLYQLEVREALVRETGKVEHWMKPRDPPMPLLKVPARPGATWTYRVPPREAAFTTGRPEVVRVPAGEFEAVPVVMALPAGVVWHRTWYAPGVPPVKWVVESGDEKTVVVLKSFAPAR